MDHRNTFVCKFMTEIKLLYSIIHESLTLYIKIMIHQSSTSSPPTGSPPVWVPVASVGSCSSSADYRLPLVPVLAGTLDPAGVPYPAGAGAPASGGAAVPSKHAGRPIGGGHTTPLLALHD